MYEELITALRETAETEQMEYGVDCYRTGEAANALESLVARLAALQAENAAKDKEIERVEAERDAARQDCAVAEENHCKAVACIQEVEEAVKFQRPSSIVVAISKWRGAQGEG